MIRKSHRYLIHAPKTVALVGMGPSIMDFFNERLTQEAKVSFADEIWAVNMAANAIWHDLVIWMDDLKKQHEFRPDLIELLKIRDRPVLTSTARPELVPCSYDYPIDEVCQMSLPVFGKPYLTNGITMGVAYAIYIGVKTLKIYGADFTYPNRDFAEAGRANVECWVTLASSKYQMRILIAPNSSLMDGVGDHGVYGYDEQPTVYLPDGGVAKYVKNTATSAIGKYRYFATGEPNAPPLHHPEDSYDPATAYRPEDSSGQPPKEAHNGPANEEGVPGARSNGADSSGPVGEPAQHVALDEVKAPA